MQLLLNNSKMQKCRNVEFRRKELNEKRSKQAAELIELNMKNMKIGKGRKHKTNYQIEN